MVSVMRLRHVAMKLESETERYHQGDLRQSLDSRQVDVVLNNADKDAFTNTC